MDPVKNIYSLPYFLLHTLRWEIYGCNINSMCTHTPESCLLMVRKRFLRLHWGSVASILCQGPVACWRGGCLYFPREAWWRSEILSFVPLSLSLEQVLQAFFFPVSEVDPRSLCRPPVSFRPRPPTRSSFMYNPDAALCLQFCACVEIQLPKREN